MMPPVSKFSWAQHSPGGAANSGGKPAFRPALVVLQQGMLGLCLDMRFPRAALALLVSIAGIAATKPTIKTKKPALTADQRAAQSIMKSMSLRDRVAQLIVGTCYGDAPATKSADYQKYRHWVRDLRIGGFIVANRVDHGAIRNAEPHAIALFLNQMQKLSKTPLLVAADFERGA